MSGLGWLRCLVANVGHRLTQNVVVRFRAGVRQTSGQVAPYRAAWEAANAEDAGRDGPLWVVLGDSAAQGVGASAFDAGYVGQVRARLTARDGVRWRVANHAVSGARVADVVRDQLPLLDQHPDADLVTCVVGGNDLVRTSTDELARSLQHLLARLPAGAVVGTLPQGLRTGKARRVNAMLRAESPHHGAGVADVWAHSGAPWVGRYADDLFHPNDLGYEGWADALWEAVGCTVTSGR